VAPSSVPTRTDIVGRGEVETDEDPVSRPQAVAYLLAKQLLHAHLAVLGEDTRPWLFPRLVGVCRDWLGRCVDLAPGFSSGHLARSAELRATAVERVDSLTEDARGTGSLPHEEMPRVAACRLGAVAAGHYVPFMGLTMSQRKAVTKVTAVRYR